MRWPKPHIRDVGRKAQLAMPRYLTVRELRVRIKQPGFRTKAIVIVTTLLDPKRYSKEDLGRVVPSALEPRARPAVDQNDDADGRVALQDAPSWCVKKSGPTCWRTT